MRRTRRTRGISRAPARPADGIGLHTHYGPVYLGPLTDWNAVRFIKADTEQGPRLGVVRPDGVAELARTESRLEPHFGDDGSALRALAAAIHADPAGEYGLESLTLLKPVDPVSMRDFMVFEEHVLPSWRRSGMSRGPDVWYEQPIGYFSNAATIRGPRDPIEIPDRGILHPLRLVRPRPPVP